MKKICLILLLAASSTAFAQKVKLVEGSLTSLKGQKEISTKFTYDNMIVGKDFTEEAYIKRKKGDYNEKEPGRGDLWEKAWVADRKERFEPQFIELFEKHSSMTTKSADAKYTLVFHTTRTEPGWNVGVMRAPARIDGEVLIVETANPSNVIAEMSVVNAPGRDAMGFDFETGYRIQEAYAKSGKEVAKLLVKQMK
jgi:hypothetical protein